jgi:hypothetical protein
MVALLQKGERLDIVLTVIQDPSYQQRNVDAGLSLLELYADG